MSRRKAAWPFWFGVAMLVAGVTLTVLGYVSTTMSNGNGFILFYSLIVLGFIRILTALPGLFRPSSNGSQDADASGSGQRAAPSSVRCWQCGTLATTTSSICLRCGATLPITRQPFAPGVSSPSGAFDSMGAAPVQQPVPTRAGPTPASPMSPAWSGPQGQPYPQPGPASGPQYPGYNPSGPAYPQQPSQPYPQQGQPYGPPAQPYPQQPNQPYPQQPNQPYPSQGQPSYPQQGQPYPQQPNQPYPPQGPQYPQSDQPNRPSGPGWGPPPPRQR